LQDPTRRARERRCEALHGCHEALLGAQLALALAPRRGRRRFAPEVLRQYRLLVRVPMAHVFEGGAERELEPLRGAGVFGDFHADRGKFGIKNGIGERDQCEPF
jgi:hypothetical protein